MSSTRAPSSGHRAAAATTSGTRGSGAAASDKPAARSPAPAAASPALSPHRALDTSGNPRIPLLMELVGSLSRADKPEQVIRTFGEAINRIYGTRGYVSLSTRGLKPGQYRVTRLSIDGVTLPLETSDPWNNSAPLPIRTGGIFGRIIRSAYPEILHHLDLRNEPVLGDVLAKYHSLMAIPLFDNGEPLNWAIQFREEPEGFTVEELERQILQANLVGGTVRNVLMTSQLRSANDRIQREIEQIARIQRALLPQELPRIAGLSIATSYETFDTAGGDLYDFAVISREPQAAPRPDDPLAMLIADASGHGPAAAVVTAMLNAILYALPPGLNLGPAEVLQYANRHLFAKGLEGSFVTAFLGLYDPRDHQLVYASAGHNPPVIKNAGSGGEVFRLESVEGVPLGVIDEANFSSGAVSLHPGQTIVMYTDGITEAMNPAREMFGVEGIERSLHECSGEPACVIQSITTALKTHQSGQKPADDQTIVAVKIDG